MAITTKLMHSDPSTCSPPVLERRLSTSGKMMSNFHGFASASRKSDFTPKSAVLPVGAKDSSPNTLAAEV
jgi:hypothetical protein